MKEYEVKKCCATCEFNMPVNGVLVCAGRTNEYGQKTPIKNVDYNECWEISFTEFEKQLKNKKTVPFF